MGPRSDERGEKMPLPGDVRVALLLQWGRALMSAESVRLSTRSMRTVIALQWGRALMSAERCLFHVHRQLRLGLASMGPRSDERGEKLGRMVAIPPGELLQWGRALMSAERRNPPPTPIGPSCFNGAAL